MQTQQQLTANFSPPTEDHAAALYSNGQREAQAWKHIRAQSGLDPDQWSKIDRAFMRGLRTPSTNATANAQTLEFDEWEDRDDMMVEETAFRLTAVDDLINAGFVRDTSLARLVSLWQSENKFDQNDVERSMDGRSVSTEDRTVTEINGVPLIISHLDWEISEREQVNSQNFGESLDTADARKAGQAIRRDLEDLAFNGFGPTVQTKNGDFSLEGYTNYTDRLTTSGRDWTAAAQNVIDDVRNMIDDLETQGSNSNEGYMPEELGAWLYIPTALWGNVTRQSDPEGDGNMNLRQRLEQDFPYLDIRHAGALGSSEAVMVIQSPDVVDLADAQAPTTQSWDIDGGFATRFKSLACRVPRLKSTRAGRAGINHYTDLQS
jgi:hypothetical protein